MDPKLELIAAKLVELAVEAIPGEESELEKREKPRTKTAEASEAQQHPLFAHTRKNTEMRLGV